MRNNCKYEPQRYYDSYGDLRDYVTSIKRVGRYSEYKYIDWNKLKEHWVNFGMFENRSPCGDVAPDCRFDARLYGLLNMDVYNACGGDNGCMLDHYRGKGGHGFWNTGVYENRRICGPIQPPDYPCTSSWRDPNPGGSRFECVKEKYLANDGVANNGGCPYTYKNVEGVCLPSGASEKGLWYSQLLQEQQTEDTLNLTKKDKNNQLEQRKKKMVDLQTLVDKQKKKIAVLELRINSWNNKIAEIPPTSAPTYPPAPMPCNANWTDPDPAKNGTVYTCVQEKYLATNSNCPDNLINVQGVCLDSQPDDSESVVWQYQLYQEKSLLNDYEFKLKDLEKQNDENTKMLMDISNQFFSIQQKSYDLSNVYLSNVSTITDLSNDITRIAPEIQNQAKLYAMMQSDYDKKIQDVSAGVVDLQTASFYNYYDKVAADVWGQLSDNTRAINEGYSGLQGTADDAINASLQDKRTLYNSILKQNNNMQSSIQKHTSDYNTRLQKNVYMDETIQEYDTWNQRFTVLYFVLLLISIFILFRTTSFSLITKATILILFIMYPWTIYPIEMALYTFFSYVYKYMIHQLYEKI